MPTHNQFFRDKTSGDPLPTALTQLGAFLSIEIHVPPQIAQVLTDQGEPVPPPVPGLALIDTGATMTCVHRRVLDQLGLKPIGTVNSGTASGVVQQEIYPGRIVFPTHGWTLDLQAVVAVDLSGQTIALEPDPQPIIALLGRNFLQRGVFIWNGTGGCWTLTL